MKAKKQAEMNIINSPFGEELGWVKGGELTKEGRDIVENIKEQNWIDEIEKRAKSAENICPVINLIYHSLGDSIDKDISFFEYGDSEVPAGFHFKEDLKKKFEKLVNMCDKYEKEKK